MGRRVLRRRFSAYASNEYIMQHLLATATPPAPLTTEIVAVCSTKWLPEVQHAPSQTGKAPKKKRSDLNFGFPNSKQLQSVVIAEVQRLLHEDVLRKSQSPLLSDVRVVRQNGGQAMKVDVKHMNCMMRGLDIDDYEHVTIPHVSDIVDKLYNATIFTVLQLNEPYYRVPLQENARKFTAIFTPIGHFEFTKYTPGLRNADAALTLALENCLGTHLKKICFAHLDQVLIYSAATSEHRRDVKAVKACLQKCKFTWDEQKSQLCKKEVNFDGFNLKRRYYTVDMQAHQRICNFPTPSNKRELRQFCELTEHYLPLVSPLILFLPYFRDILRKRVFKWTLNANNFFDVLKQTFIDPLQYYPNATKTFHIYAESCEAVVGIQVYQKVGGHFLNVGYVGRGTIPVKLRRAKREMRAFLWGVPRLLNAFPRGAAFRFYTNVKRFKAEMTTKIATRIDKLFADANASYILCEKKEMKILQILQ